MKFFPALAMAMGMTLISCGPIEPRAQDSGSLYSQESVGQWQPDLHDMRIVADRTVLAEINRMLLATPEAGVPLAEYSFGDSESAEDFRYIDLTRGFAIDLPYNENWSTGTYVLPPFEKFEEVSEIRFGPLLFHAQNGYQRAYILRYIPARALEAAEQAYETGHGLKPEGVTVEQIGSGSAVVMGSMGGECPAPVIEVSGEDFNYVLTTSCEAASRWADALERLKVVAETFKQSNE